MAVQTTIAAALQDKIDAKAALKAELILGGANVTDELLSEYPDFVKFVKNYTAYNSRVLADSGTVDNDELLKSNFEFFISNGILANVLFAWNEFAGAKDNKAYNLYGTTDLVGTQTYDRGMMCFNGTDQNATLDVSGYSTIAIAYRTGDEVIITNSLTELGEISGNTLYLGSNVAETEFYSFDLLALVVLNTSAYQLVESYLEMIPLGSNLNYKLPEKLINGESLKVLDFENTTGLSANGGTLSLNSSEVYSGNYSIKFSGNDSGNTNVSKSITLTEDQIKNFKLAIYLHDVQDSEHLVRIDLHDGVYNKYMIQTFTVGPDNLNSGRWILLGGKKWVTYNGVVASDITTLRLTLVGFGTRSISFDLLEFGLNLYPACLITFDDGKASDYELAYPVLRDKRMVATHYIVSDYINTDGFMTTEQIIGLNNSGHDIGNHTKSHADLALLTEEQILTELNGCKSFLDGIGLTRASDHVAYPFNSVNDTVYSAMSTFTEKYGRISGTYGNIHNGYNLPYNVYVYSLDSSADPDGDDVKAHIDNCILRGRTPGILIHKIVESGRGGILLSTFTDIVNYISNLGLKTITINEFYRLRNSDILINHK